MCMCGLYTESEKHIQAICFGGEWWGLSRDMVRTHAVLLPSSAVRFTQWGFVQVCFMCLHLVLLNTPACFVFASRTT